jgi:hypothetical protein
MNWEGALEKQIAEMNKHLYQAYARIVQLQEENSKLKEQLVTAELVLEK